MDEIKKLVGMQLGKRNVQESDRFVEDLGAESADVANIVATVEEKYGITIKEAEIASISTASDLLTLIQKRAP
jgi:acyl carrier protein